MRRKKFFVAILTLVVVVILATPSMGAVKVPPYKDVTKASVGKDAYKAVVLVYNWGSLRVCLGKK